MDTQSQLADRENEHLIVVSGGSSNLVIGVPHHAPLGVSYLPSLDQRDSDENAGYIGYQIAQTLHCACVIACNARFDPNKSETTPYYKAIAAMQPRILVEIHGHSGDKTPFDIEISCGNLSNNSLSRKLAGYLRAGLRANPIFKEYKLSGDFDLIYYRASKTITINTEQWIAFHVELPKKIRGSQEIYEPFSVILANAIRQVVADLEE
ncbi:MAG TPA: hypothetical protein VN376_08970 [Longilinea sp.]|nr:hypothetical protein [Longilinea sp.]